ncbi:hypothetical protein ACIBUR_33650 [Streptomyces anulatus]
MLADLPHSELSADEQQLTNTIKLLIYEGGETSAFTLQRLKATMRVVITDTPSSPLSCGDVAG